MDSRQNTKKYVDVPWASRTNVSLPLVGVRVVPFVPVGEVLVVAGPHDGSPACIARPVSLVVGRSTNHTVVAESQSVPNLVRYRFGHEFLVAVVQITLEYPHRRVRSPGPASDVGHATGIVKPTISRSTQLRLSGILSPFQDSSRFRTS